MKAGLRSIPLPAGVVRFRMRGGPSCLLKLRQMGAQRAQMKGVLPWLVNWALRADTRDFCPTLAALVDPVQNIFFLTVHYFNSFVVQGRLSRNVCLWLDYSAGSYCINIRRNLR
jgi:hypothetical protein